MTDPASVTSLPVEFLFTITADISVAGMIGNGPAGTRLVVNVPGGTFEGPKLKGTVVPPGGDWVTLRADGSMHLDVRLMLKTDAGAAILMTYTGVGTAGPDGAIRTAPTFQAGDESVAWLNGVQAVGLGSSDGQTVRYDVYRLL
jgi:hypothetical protein